MWTCPECRKFYRGDVAHCSADGARLEAFKDDPFVGRLLDHHRVLAFSGEGVLGGRRYEATRLDRRYRIDILPGEIAADQTIVQRLRKNAIEVGKLRHPNIANASDFKVSDEGLAYLVEEVVDGETRETLETLETLETAVLRRGVFDLEAALQTTLEIVSALKVAHSRGVIHRRLSPRRILLDPEKGAGTRRSVRVTGFDLTDLREAFHMPLAFRALDAETTEPHLAPELIIGLEASSATDLYAVGSVLHFMLTGKPFVENVVDLLLGRTAMNFVAPVSPDVVPLLQHLLMRAPEDRPQFADQVIDEIHRLVREGQRARMPTDALPDMPMDDSTPTDMTLRIRAVPSETRTQSLERNQSTGSSPPVPIQPMETGPQAESWVRENVRGARDPADSTPADSKSVVASDWSLEIPEAVTSRASVAPPLGVPSHGRATASPDWPLTTKELGMLLVQLKLIAGQTLTLLEARKLVSKQRLTKLLAELEPDLEMRVVRVLAERLGLGVYARSEAPVHSRVLESIPPSLAIEVGALPFALKRDQGRDVLFVAIAEPVLNPTRTVIESVVPGAIVWHLARDSEIDAGLERYYRSSPGERDLIERDVIERNVDRNRMEPNELAIASGERV